MKTRLLLLLTLLAVLGCSGKIDTAKLRAAFASMDPGPKAQLEEAFTDIDAGKYQEAILPMKKTAFSTKLTKEQADLLRDTMAKVQARAGKSQ